MSISDGLYQSTRGHRDPPHSTPFGGDDGQLVRICGTITRAGPVKAPEQRNGGTGGNWVEKSLLGGFKHGLIMVSSG